MKIYHTQTKEDFEDFKSKYGLPHTLKWEEYKENTGISLGENFFSVMHIGKAERRYPGYEVVKYERDTCQEMFMGRVVENHDVVNSPKHYTNGELEVIDILQDKLTAQEFEGFLKGNILKYTFREGIKNGTEDMKKGAWYMSKLIDFRNGQEAEDGKNQNKYQS